MRFLVFLALCALVAVATATKDMIYNLEDAPQLFEQFIKDYDRHYKTPKEKTMRYNIFVEKLIEMNKLNAETEMTSFGINKFTDWTDEEFKGTLGFKPPKDWMSPTPDVM